MQLLLYLLSLGCYPSKEHLLKGSTVTAAEFNLKKSDDTGNHLSFLLLLVTRKGADSINTFCLDFEESCAISYQLPAFSLRYPDHEREKRAGCHTGHCLHDARSFPTPMQRL